MHFAYYYFKCFIQSVLPVFKLLLRYWKSLMQLVAIATVIRCSRLLHCFSWSHLFFCTSRKGGGIAFHFKLSLIQVKNKVVWIIHKVEIYYNKTGRMVQNWPKNYLIIVSTSEQPNHTINPFLSINFNIFIYIFSWFMCAAP